MELLSMAPAAWAALQAVTLTQIAVGALVTLVAAAALFAFVRYMQSGAPPLHASGDSSQRSSGASSLDDFSLKKPPKMSETTDVESVTANLQERFDVAKGLPKDNQQRQTFVKELVGWLDVDHVDGLDQTDFTKTQLLRKTFLKELLKDNMSAYFDVVIVPSTIPGFVGRDLIPVKANGNCGYYAFAGRLLMMSDYLGEKLNGFSDNFIDLARELRREAFGLAQSDFDVFADILLIGASETWVEGKLREYLINYLTETSLGGSCFHQPARQTLKQVLDLSDDENQKFYVAIENLVACARREGEAALDGLVSGGIPGATVLTLMGQKPDNHFKDLYKAEISRHAPEEGEGTGFWASPFELYLLAKRFEVPLTIFRPDDEPIVLNHEGAGLDTPCIEIYYNGIDHFEILMPQ